METKENRKKSICRIDDQRDRKSIHETYELLKKVTKHRYNKTNNKKSLQKNCNNNFRRLENEI